MNNINIYKNLLNKSYKNFKSEKPANFRINEVGIVEIYDKNGKILGLYSQEMFDELKKYGK